MSRPATSFTTRLFLALFLLSALPTAALLGLATWGLRDYVQLTGGADRWTEVAETGSALLGTIETDSDSAVRSTAGAHEEALSRSVRMARRFDLVAARLADQLPWIAVTLGLVLAGLSLWLARRTARQLSRPVGELVDWAGRLAREEALPEPGRGDDRGPREFVALRRAFRDMAERLAAGRARALEAERFRSWTEMARRVAHELKNPLTPLSLAVRGARRAVDEGATDALHDHLSVIEDESRRLDEMARSFAQLGRLPDEPTIEIDLRELLEELVASDLPPSVVVGVRAPATVPPVSGGLAAFNRAFRNLLGNALEAIGERSDGRIEVSMEVTNGAVRVIIEDNGPGVPPEHRERLWDPDFTTKTRGTGLGLALVRQTVRAHGGEVELADSDGGARFVVTLPASGGSRV